MCVSVCVCVCVCVCVLACLHMPPVRYVFCVQQSQSLSEILQNVVHVYILSISNDFY